MLPSFSAAAAMAYLPGISDGHFSKAAQQPNFKR